MWNEVDLNCGNTDEKEMRSSQLYLQFKQLQILARKKLFKRFNRIRTHGLCVSAAMLYRLSYEDANVGSKPFYWVHLYPWQERDVKWSLIGYRREGIKRGIAVVREGILLTWVGSKICNPCYENMNLEINNVTGNEFLQIFWVEINILENLRKALTLQKGRIEDRKKQKNKQKKAKLQRGEKKKPNDSSCREKVNKRRERKPNRYPYLKKSSVYFSYRDDDLVIFKGVLWRKYHLSYPRHFKT